MASLSTNLLLSLFAQGDSTGNGFDNWGDSANSNFEFLEDALTETSSITVTNANVTLTAEQARSLRILTSGVLTGNRDVIVPARKHFFVAYNGNTGSFTLTFKVSGQTGVVVAQGTYAILYCDGTDVVSILNAPYSRSTAIGTVSQSGGNPTGPLFEHSEGATVSGSYSDLVRFADGTQIVRGKQVLLREATIRMGATLTFPKVFIDNDYSVQATLRPQNNADPASSFAANCDLDPRDILAPVNGSRTTTDVNISVYAVQGAGTFGPNDELYVDYTITGRWF
jgi:hypothetical protein